MMELKADMDLDKEIAAKGDNPVFVKFYAQWCGGCKKLAPILEKKTNEKGYFLINIDVDECEELAEKYEVSSIPRVLVFKGGKKVFDFIGNNAEKVDKAFEAAA